ncbi:hypothetical protein [Phenylobacterium sp.]|jgi:hypothetical protein|uniref:hypothetical protein n=1 Tax=Phenylobacterium sp. TaxID=1871053 RepID=UPI002F4258E8
MSGGDPILPVEAGSRLGQIRAALGALDPYLASSWYLIAIVLSGAWLVAILILERRRAIILASLVTPIFSFVVSMLISLYGGPRGLQVVEKITRPFGQVAMVALGGAGIGWGLVVLRRRYRIIYGYVEVLVSVGLLCIVGLQLFSKDALANLVAFLSAIYVFVRGFTNIDDGRAKG